MEAFGIILDFLRTDIFISFGLLTIPFLIGRYIPKIKDMISKMDEMASRFIIFSGIVYTVVIILSYVYLFLIKGDPTNEYAITNRVTGPYAWAYWVMPFSWLFITQFFCFKLVRRNVIIRILFIPFFLFTYERFVIIITSWHRDYLPEGWTGFNLESILSATPYWPLHLLLKLGLFIGYVFLFQWISKKIKRNKVVS